MKKHSICAVVLAITLMLTGCDLSISNPREEESSIKLPVKNNLVLHLQADRGVAMEEGRVTGWIDYSLQGNNLDAVGDPRLILEGLKDQPTIHFDGQEDLVESNFELKGLPTGNSDRTMFMVAKYNSKGYGGFSYGKPSNNNSFGLVVDSEGYLAVQAWGQKNDNLSKVDGNGSGWLTQSVKLQSGVLTHYKNGVQLNSISHDYNTISQQLIIGAEIDRELHIDMEIAEIIIFARALNETERQQVESYLQQRYFAKS
ncbi:hypothetical protein [Pleurocapsa sp. PCC 7319]|uniref:hypothetical protein n=1 Tax=Pleurocapsa sp. PCC 7319 TaxID=118161 RepID=UPI0003671291|nr:hypothetical protein [Pleurocapsa sp. PCC 7319]